MTHRLAILASLLVLSAAVVTPCAAQPATQSPSATTGPASPATPAAPASSADSPSAPSPGAKSDTPAATPTDSSEPSAETLRMARKEGFKPKKRDGKTMFCYSSASLGTKLETEKCYSQTEMEQQVQLRREQREQLGRAGACTGASCSGH